MSFPRLLAIALLVLVPRPGAAQHYQTDFPPEEFRARWQKVFDRIGENAVAVVQGMPQAEGFTYPRQYNSVSCSSITRQCCPGSARV